MPLPLSLTTISTCELTRSSRTCTSPSLGREFHRIRQQVPDDLLQSIGIAGDRCGARIENRLHTNLLGIRRGAKGLDGVGDDTRQIDGLHIQTELPGDDPGHIEDVSDDLIQCGRISRDGVQRLRVLVGH